MTESMCRLPIRRPEWRWLLALAGLLTLAHLATSSRYGFHRDELQVLSDALHLDFGFVPYPPLTPLIERLGLELFGLSMAGLRSFSILAQSAAVLLTGCLCARLGGGRKAQLTSALLVAFSGLPLFESTEFQYTSFDYLWWVLTAYAVVRVLTGAHPRWWLLAGVAVGLGLETKYNILFLVVGLLLGLALNGERTRLTGRWFWAAVALATLLALPNLIWLIRHDWITYHFLQSIHRRDIAQGRGAGFWINQIRTCINPMGIPLVVAGLIAFARSPRLRPLLWMFLAPLAIFVAVKANSYYLAGGYPMLVAGGAVVAEGWLAARSALVRRSIQGFFFAGFAVVSTLLCAAIIPLADSGPLRAFALARNGDMREEFGWDELMRELATIRDRLPADQQSSVGIVTGNYGEAGAVELLGPAYHLPKPISMTNSAWLRGYPTPQPTALIVVGFSRRGADRAFTNCQLAGHNGNSQGVHNEESDTVPEIFLCGPPRLPWPQFWAKYRNFG